MGGNTPSADLRRSRSCGLRAVLEELPHTPIRQELARPELKFPLLCPALTSVALPIHLISSCTGLRRLSHPPLICNKKKEKKNKNKIRPLRHKAMIQIGDRLLIIDRRRRQFHSSVDFFHQPGSGSSGQGMGRSI